MKILLISPPIEDVDRFHAEVRGCMPPLDLMYLAGYLIRHSSHEVRILDLYASPMKMRAFLKYVEDYVPQVIGFSTYTAGLVQVYSFSESIKKHLPSVKIVLGGIHASYLTGVCLSHPAVDFVVRGEGEETFLDLVNALPHGGVQAIPGIAFRSGDKVMSTPDRRLIEDLDGLPWPAHHLIDPKKYHLSITRAVTGARAASLLTSRGCLNRCSFCSKHFHYFKRVRKRSAQNVLEELKYLYDVYGAREFQFEDCTFTFDQDHVLEICSLIRRSKLKIFWNCNIRANMDAEKLFPAMKEAGCENVLLGVESGSQKILDLMKKDITLDQVRRTVALSKKYGIRLNATFLIGIPGETLETARETGRFVIELDPDYAMFSVLVPSVGSEFFDLAVQEGKIDVRTVQGADWITLYSERAPIVDLCGIGKKELARLMEKFTLDFYLRPRYIGGRIVKIRSFLEVVQLWKGLKAIIRHQIRI